MKAPNRMSESSPVPKALPTRPNGLTTQPHSTATNITTHNSEPPQVEDEDETSSSGTSSDYDPSSDESDSDSAHPPPPPPTIPAPRIPPHSSSTTTADLRSRLSAFLPQIAKANSEQQGQQRIDDVADDEEHYIEMDLGLGVLSQLPADGGIKGLEGLVDEESSEDGDDEGGGGKGTGKGKRLLVESLSDGEDGEDDVVKRT